MTVMTIMTWATRHVQSVGAKSTKGKVCITVVDSYIVPAGELRKFRDTGSMGDVISCKVPIMTRMTT